MGNKNNKEYNSNLGNTKGLDKIKGKKTVSIFTLGCPRVNPNMIATASYIA